MDISLTTVSFTATDKKRFNNWKLYAHGSGVASNKIDQLQANKSHEWVLFFSFCAWDRAAFACLSYNTLPVSITQNVMYVRLQKDAVESFHSIIIIIISSVP